MSIAEYSAPSNSMPELSWVGDGGWVACDPQLPANDAHRIIAYVECKDHQVYVLWMHRLGEVSCFETLRDAVQAIGAAQSQPS